MALLTTIEELKAVLDIPPSSTGKMISVETTEYDYILPVLGEDLYTELDEAKAAANLTAQQTKLLGYIHAAVAPLAMTKALASKLVTIDLNGLYVIETQEVRTPYKWEYNKAHDELMNKGYAALEALLVFLKIHTDDYPSWSNSPYNDNNNFALIRGGDDLRNIMSLEQRHRCYLALKPILELEVRDYLVAALGEEFYLDYNTKLLAGTLTAEEKTILPKLRVVAMRVAMRYAAITMYLKFSTRGFTIIEEQEHGITEGELQAKETQITRFIKNMEQESDKEISNVLTYMNSKASATVFPIFFSSSLYEDPNETHGINNENYTGFFGV